MSLSVPDRLSLTVSDNEMRISSHDECKRRGRPRQGRCHPRRLGGRRTVLAGGVGGPHRPQSGHGPPAGRGPGEARPRGAGRRRPLRARRPPHGHHPGTGGPARAGGPAGPDGGEQPALRAAQRPPGVRGVHRVAPRPADHRARRCRAAPRQGVGGQGAAVDRRGGAQRLGPERRGAGEGRGVGERAGVPRGRHRGRGVGVGPGRADDAGAGQALRRRGRGRRPSHRAGHGVGLNDRDRAIVRLAVPAFGTLAVEPLYVLVDTAIVGRLGTVPLGGLALASTVLASLLWVFNFLSYGTTARVAFLTGGGDHRGAGAVAAQGLWLCVLIGVPLAAGVAIGRGPLVALVGGEGEIAAAARTYLLISTVGMPAVLVMLVGHGYLRGVADTRTPLVVAVASNVLNLVLEIVLVYGFDLGVAGSAWGTVVAQLLGAWWFLALLRRRFRDVQTPRALVGAEVRRLLLAGRHLFVRT